MLDLEAFARAQRRRHPRTRLRTRSAGISSSTGSPGHRAALAYDPVTVNRLRRIGQQTASIFPVRWLLSRPHAARRSLEPVIAAAFADALASMASAFPLPLERSNWKAIGATVVVMFS